MFLSTWREQKQSLPNLVVWESAITAIRWCIAHFDVKNLWLFARCKKNAIRSRPPSPVGNQRERIDEKNWIKTQKICVAALNLVIFFVGICCTLWPSYFCTGFFRRPISRIDFSIGFVRTIAVGILFHFVLIVGKDTVKKRFRKRTSLVKTIFQI